VKQKMETKQISVSIAVVVNDKVARRDFLIDWIECDDAETIAEDIKEAILNIE